MFFQLSMKTKYDIAEYSFKKVCYFRVFLIFMLALKKRLLISECSFRYNLYLNGVW